MWVGITGDSRIAVFLYNRHRSGQAALELLEGSQPGDYLMIDDCSSFNKPIKKLKLIDLRCLIHIRSNEKLVIMERNSNKMSDFTILCYFHFPLYFLFTKVFQPF